MKTLTIGTKISLACTALVALTIVLGTLTAWNISQMNTDIHGLVEGPLPGVYSVGLIEEYLKEQKVRMLEHILSDDPNQMSQKESALSELENKIQSEWKSYQ